MLLVDCACWCCRLLVVVCRLLVVAVRLAFVDRGCVWCVVCVLVDVTCLLFGVVRVCVLRVVVCWLLLSVV